jgi:hypothetical protein
MNWRGFTLVGLGLLICFVAAFLFLHPSSTVSVKNTTELAIAVALETDVGESYHVGAIEPSQSARTPISGRDKLTWVVVRFPDGREIQSEKVYTTSGVYVSASVRSDHVEIRYGE